MIVTRLMGLAGVVLALCVTACDPVVGITVTNGCRSTVWVRLGGSPEHLPRVEPTELAPSASVRLQSVGNSATLAVSAVRTEIGQTREVVRKQGPITLGGADCPSGA